MSPDAPPIQADESQTRCTASSITPIQTDGSTARVRQPDEKKSTAWCMIQVKMRLVSDLIQ
jgi:hypothetical protein